MSMGSVYTTVSLISLILLAMKLAREMTAFNLLHLFLGLISLSFPCPTVQTVDVEAVERNHKSHGGKYHADTLQLAKLYFSTTAILSDVCSISKTLQSTPNTDRLLELHQTSMPLYGLTLLFADMVFEGNL